MGLINRTGKQIETFNFSIDEKWTGKTWIDGKKIYCKIINFGSLPKNTEKRIAHNILNINDIISILCVAQNEGAAMPIPYVHSRTTDMVGLSFIKSNGGTVNIFTYYDTRDVYNECYVTLYYTCKDR